MLSSKSFILTLFFLGCCLFGVRSLRAQTNLQYNIYAKEKHCQPKFWYNQSAVIHIDSKGRRWGTLVASKPGKSSQIVFCRFNAQWDSVYSREIGGSDDDWIDFIRELPNGNLLLVGYTSSKDGDIWFGHNYASREILMLEMDTLCNIVKGKTFGGGNGSEPNDVIISSDGYIYLAGNTIANDYDFYCINYGSMDASAWVAKYDTAFNKKWINMYVGNADEGSTTIREISPNRLIVGFGTNSTSPEVLPAFGKGLSDLLVVFVDSNGSALWKKRYGSSSYDWGRRCVVDPAMKDIYFVCSSWFHPGVGGVGVADGDITYKSGTAWILKIDTIGNIKASKAYGVHNDGTFIEDALWWNNRVFIMTFSNGRGGGDADTVYPSAQQSQCNIQWFGLFDTNATLVGSHTIKNDSNNVEAKNIIRYQEGVWASVVFNSNLNPYKCEPLKDTTAAFFYLSDAPLGVSEEALVPERELIAIHPNPSSNTLKIDVQAEATGKEVLVEVFDVWGRMVHRQSVFSIAMLDLSAWPNGPYLIRASSGTYRQTEKFMKQ